MLDGNSYTNKSCNMENPKAVEPEDYFQIVLVPQKASCSDDSFTIKVGRGRLNEVLDILKIDYDIKILS
ncbi:hypothetical protein ACJDU8_17715 [Clostridium sp. WILCCON 0269]|uniref:Uncharacterized protein n=1 Tax=Candidatus Clostridium eludens TaxID=3381663 RepID=A0ABW8SN94_9CLOT